MTVLPIATMSKALWAAAGPAAATRPGTTAPSERPFFDAPAVTLLALGVCVLVGWTAFRLARPRKFLLRRVPARRNEVSVLHAAAVFLAYLLATSLVYSGLSGLLGVEAPDAPGWVTLVAGAFGQLLLIAGSLAVAELTFARGLRRGLGLTVRRFGWDAGRAVIGFLALLPVVLALSVLSAMVMESLRREWVRTHPVLVLLLTGEASPALKAGAIFGAVVMAAAAEEIFYRGLLQSMLKRYLGGRAWPALLIASAAFAASHLNQPQAVPALFVLALGLGYNYERTGRLTAPILMHAIFNAAMIWAALSAGG